MQPACATVLQAFEFDLQIGEDRQNLFRRRQQAQTRCRQTQRFRPTHKEFDARLIFDPFDLVAQGRLRDVQQIRRTGQPARVMDRLNRAKMPYLNVHHEQTS